VHGTAEVLAPADTLVVGGEGGGFRHLGGRLAFFNSQGLQTPPRIGGSLIASLDATIRALSATGYAVDERLADWGQLAIILESLAAVGPFVTGRLVVGSTGGWTALDLPAERPGMVQCPARAGGVLAYVPVTSMTAMPPPRPEVGCLWGDVSNGAARIRLRMFDGNAWIDALPQRLLNLQDAIGTAPANALLIGDGERWTPLAPGLRGQILRVDDTGVGWGDGVRVGTTPPWPNGSLRPNDNGVIWLDTTPAGEAVAFWNAQARRWVRSIADSEGLSELSTLFPALRDSELLMFESGSLVGLAPGNDGDNLRSRGGSLSWEPTMRVSATRGGVQPVPGHSGDFWLAGSALFAHDGTSWREVGLDSWEATFGGSSAIGAGTPLMLDSGGWHLGDGAAAGAVERSYAIAMTPADPGATVAACWRGVLTLDQNDWYRALDRDAQALVINGLPVDRELWLSRTEPGRLSVNPASGALVGRSLSASSLLLAGDGQSWARNTGAGNATAGTWWDAVLAPDLAARLISGDLLGWTGTSFDIATGIPGDRLAVRLKHSTQLADPVSGGDQPSGTPGAVARPPTVTGLPDGTSELVDGELHLGTSPQDPALFWRLSDGTTTRISRGDLGRTYGLIATDLASDPDAAMIELTDSAGGRQSVVLRGADGLEVTRTNIGTLVVSGAELRSELTRIDGGRFGAYRAPGARTSAPIDAGDFSRSGRSLPILAVSTPERSAP
jgi:hypothetical protein